MKYLLFIAIALLFFNSCSKDSDGESETNSETEEVEGDTTTTTVEIDYSEPIRGVNWADPDDNFADDQLILSGLNSGESYTTVAYTASYVIKGFINNLSANAVRMPINYPTVSTTWWSSYKGAIDKAISLGMRVVLAYWESESYTDGLVDNENEFWDMWSQVIEDYGDNDAVYFEVMNEPYGYSLEDLTDLYETWLETYPDVSHSRILLGGEGYSENVTGVAADERFSDCLLSLHNYAFWADRTRDEWKEDWEERIGDYASRTVVTEFGAAMTTGYDYSDTSSVDNEIVYMQVSTSLFEEDSIQSVYWPGLRDDDSYTIQEFDGDEMTTTNESGVALIQYGWGL